MCDLQYSTMVLSCPLTTRMFFTGSGKEERKKNKPTWREMCLSLTSVQDKDKFKVTMLGEVDASR